MTQEQERAAEIAEGLSEAQRRLLCSHPFWAGSTYSTVKALRKRGLLKDAEITPLGQQVRDHLNSKEPTQ